ncbi:MAG: hypothetical protein U0990_08790 [Candidatus Nanopelagicales bacterium]|nr:hypothetical protein [Candidatus Nanopelagicales bacterium]MDZ4250173.1 hypothetical protein [Candidatus Nanopelagicales bacterium]
MEGWDPDGTVLVVLTSASADLAEDVVRRLPGSKIEILTVRRHPRPKQRWRRAVRRAVRGGRRLPHPDEPGALAIRSKLAADPMISSVLALDKDAIRATRRALAGDERVAGFAHLDHLERAVRDRLAIDLTPAGARRYDDRFVIEAVLRASPEERPCQLVLGGVNLDGRAAAMAGALEYHADVAALSVLIGQSGFPADVMVSQADWSEDEPTGLARGQIQSATHALLDWPGPEGLAAALVNTVRAWLCDQPEIGGPESGRQFTTRHDMVTEDCSWLPAALPSGLLKPTGAVRWPRARLVVVVVDSDSRAVSKAVSGQAWDDSGTQVVDLHSLDPLLRLPTASSADAVIDLRASPIADLPVLSGIIGGGVWVANVTATAGQARWLPPWVPAGTDPFATVSAVLADPGFPALRTAGRSFVRDHHDGRATARVLKRFLDETAVRP